MRNGYFQLVKAPGGYGIRFFPPEEGGREIIPADVFHYLEKAGVPYDTDMIKKYIIMQKDAVCFLGRKDCPVLDEAYTLEVSSDNMEVTACFYPSSQTGKRLHKEDFLRNLELRKMTAEVQEETLKQHFETEGVYFIPLVIAKGIPPRHGTDARIEYLFNTDIQARPSLREDGTVDFFNLNVINHCKKGDVLARIIPEDPGEAGSTVFGARIPPRTVKKAVLKFGKNIELSEDKLEITSLVNGHVTLVDDKVFVSDVYEVENVDLSTGNIEFDGSVQVNGNVAANYVVKAGGNVIVNGVVEGAYITAGGSIIIARGMNGMGKGKLEAGENIVAKFFENTEVKAEGYVSAEAALHTDIQAGTEVTVVGKRGFITGGHIQAGNRIVVKNLGANLGSSTIAEVGINSDAKAEYVQLQKEVMELVKTIKSTQPIITSFQEKRAKGVRFNLEQLRHIKEAADILEKAKKELEEKSLWMQKLQSSIDGKRKAEVVIEGTAYPGTTIIIGDVSTTLQSRYQHCKFERRDGDVKMASI